MDERIRQHIQQTLRHLYINPLERCNLKCKICYTKKTDPMLTQSEIETFIRRYEAVQKLETITFCGGEVFALPYFPTLVNEFTGRGIFVQVITNGTIDKLDDFVRPNFVNLIVSLDGLRPYHDANRGTGNFDISVAFLQKAHARGFHTEVFTIVTKQNYPVLDIFEDTLRVQLGHAVRVTYHPRKPPMYLSHHPQSNVVGQIEGFDFLDSQEMVTLLQTRNVFPPKSLGCYQIAVASDGKVYGCCEGTVPIGTIEDAIEMLHAAMIARIQLWESENTLKQCLGCSQPDFMCGIKTYLQLLEQIP